MILILIVAAAAQDSSWKEENFSGEPPAEVLRSANGRIEVVRIVGRRFLYHPNGIQTLSVSPDGKTVFSGGSDGTIKSWNAVDGREIRRWRAGDGRTSIEALTVTSDGATVLSGASGGTVKAWDPASGQERLVFSEASRPDLKIAFHPAGTSFLAYDRADLRLVEVANGRVLNQWKPGCDKAVFSPDGATALLLDGTLRLRWWEMPSGKERGSWTLMSNELFLHRREGPAVMTSKIGGTRLRDLTSGKDVWETELKATSGLQGVKVFAGGAQYLLWDLGQVYVFDAATGRLVKTHRISSNVLTAAVYPDDRTAALALQTGSVVLLNLETGKIQGPPAGDLTELLAVDLSPDLESVIGGGRDGTLRRWELKTGKERSRWKVPGNVPPGAVAWTPDGRSVISGGEFARVWDASTGKVVREWKDSAKPHQIAFSPDGKSVLVAGEWVDLYDAKSGKRLRRWMVAYGVAFHPDGKHVLATTNEYFRLHHVEQDAEVDIWKGASGSLPVFRADGRRFFACAWRLTLWDFESRKEVAAWADNTVGSRWGALGPSGTALTLNRDETLRLWDVETGKELDRIVVNGGATGMSVRGTIVAVGNRDSSIMLYQVK